MSKKVLFLDLETTGLNANRDHILCGVGKWSGSKKFEVFRIDNTTGYGRTPRSLRDDSVITKRLVELAGEADAVVAYYGGYGKFDIPFLNTRALYNGLSPLPQMSVIDPYMTAKGKLRLERNNLGAVSTVLRCKHRKYHLPPHVWHDAIYGDKPALNKLVEYCKNDVLCLEEVYTKLLPVMSAHPNVSSSRTGCPVCGSDRSSSKGRRFTKTVEYRRRQCLSCGHNYQIGARVK